MIEGDAQAAFQEKAEEKGWFTRGFAPASLTPLHLFLSLVLFLPFCFLLSSSLFSFLTTTYTYLPFLFSLSSFDYGTILVLVLADPALARPGHLPPLDLNPIYLSTAETLRIFAWLAHSNFLADA